MSREKAVGFGRFFCLGWFLFWFAGAPDAIDLRRRLATSGGPIAMLFKLLLLVAVIVAVLTVFSVIGKVKKKGAQAREGDDDTGAIGDDGDDAAR